MSKRCIVHVYPVELKNGQKVQVIDNRGVLEGGHVDYAGKIVTVKEKHSVKSPKDHVRIKEFQEDSTLSWIPVDRLRLSLNILNEELFEL